jgi:hypothetical protein
VYGLRTIAKNWVLPIYLFVFIGKRLIRREISLSEPVATAVGTGLATKRVGQIPQANRRSMSSTASARMY